MSDLPALLWSLVTIYAALRGREHAGWRIGCGLALSLAVLVRPTNLLLVGPVIFALGLRPQNYPGLVLGGAPGALLLAYYQFHVYGSVFTTGYGAVESAFSPGFLPHNLVHLARWIPGLLSPLVGAALAAPFLPGPAKRDVRVMALWVALLAGFYAFYFHTGESWWYLRFILPGFPLLILGLLAVLRKLVDQLPRASAVFLAGVFALAAAWELTVLHRLDPVGIVGEEKTYPLAAEWVRRNLPPDSAIFCMQVSGALYYYTDFLLVRWDQIENGRVTALLDLLQAQHRPVFAVLYPFETGGALGRLGGDWEDIGKAGQATVWRRKN